MYSLAELLRQYAKSRPESLCIAFDGEFISFASSISAVIVWFLCYLAKDWWQVIEWLFWQLISRRFLSYCLPVPNLG